MAIKSNNWNQFSSFDGKLSFVNTYEPEQGFMDRSVRMGRNLGILFGTGNFFARPVTLRIFIFLFGLVRSELNWGQTLGSESVRETDWFWSMDHPGRATKLL